MNHPIKVAFAVGTKGEFGNGDGLPWGAPLKKDMEYFREFTKGCVLVMGKNTFESLPKRINDLDRDCVVISRQHAKTHPRAKNGDMVKEYCAMGELSLSDALEAISDSYNKPVCVIGGAELIQQSVCLADEIMFTTVQDVENSDMEHTVSLDTSDMRTKVYDGGRVGVYNSVTDYYNNGLDLQFRTCTRWMRFGNDTPIWYER